MGLDEYLQKQSTQDVDSAEQKRVETINKFKSLVSDLFDKVSKEWLKQYVDDQRISIDIEEIAISEEKLGEYSVPTMKIKILNKVVELRPKGTIMIGTDARIDVVYWGVSRKMIVRAPEKMTSAMQMIDVHVVGEKPRKSKNYGQMEWKVVELSDRNSIQTLNKESFEQLLVNVVVNG